MRKWAGDISFITLRRRNSATENNPHFLDFYIAVDAYCIPMMLCYFDVILTPELSIEPHHRKLWVCWFTKHEESCTSQWNSSFPTSECVLAFCVFVCMYSRQQLSKGPCKYCFSVLPCSGKDLGLGKALFFSSPPSIGNIALINTVSHLFKTQILNLTDFNRTSHNQHIIQMTTLPHLWDWKLIQISSKSLDFHHILLLFKGKIMDHSLYQSQYLQ